MSEGQNTPGWTVETAMEWWKSLRAADKEALKIALDSSNKAVNKAEQAQQRVNEGQNEFRGALKDQAATLLSRDEYNAAHTSLQKQVDNLSRIVFIGLGIAIALQFIIPLLIK